MNNTKTKLKNNFVDNIFDLMHNDLLSKRRKLSGKPGKLKWEKRSN